MAVRFSLGIAAALSATSILTACGGGGGGSAGDTNAVATTPTTASTSPNLALAAVDNFTFTGALAGTGTGLWSGTEGASDGGDGDGGGAAGDGEFVKLNMKFPFAGSSTGTLKWTVLRSQYGITGKTGSLTITQDRSGAGGYKVTAVDGVAANVRPTQGNFFVSASGQINGTLPLPIGINNRVKDALFNGVRFTDAKNSATDFSLVAGQFRFGAMDAIAGTGGEADVKVGVLNLDAKGRGRICLGSFSYADNCSNGLDIVASFDDPAVRNVIQFVHAPSQSTASNFTTFNMLAVARKFDSGDGISLTGDFTIADKLSSKTRTGALYASRSTSLTPTSLIGAWNFKGRVVGQDGGDASALIAVAQVGTVVKMRFSNASSATGCSDDPADNNTINSSIATGVLTSVDARVSATPGYLIQLDVDTLVLADPASTVEAIGLVRRLSKDPTKAPCQPY